MVSFCSGRPSQKGFAGSSELVSQCIEHGNQYPVGIESPIFVFSEPFWVSSSFSLHVMMTEQENKEAVSLSLYQLYQIFSFYRTCSISFISPFLLLLCFSTLIQPIFDYFRLSLKPDIGYIYTGACLLLVIIRPSLCFSWLFKQPGWMKWKQKLHSE